MIPLGLGFIYQLRGSTRVPTRSSIMVLQGIPKLFYIRVPTRDSSTVGLFLMPDRGRCPWNQILGRDRTFENCPWHTRKLACRGFQVFFWLAVRTLTFCVFI